MLGIEPNLPLWEKAPYGASTSWLNIEIKWKSSETLTKRTIRTLGQTSSITNS